jgi:predicted N-acetyltransferase YhbS
MNFVVGCIAAARTDHVLFELAQGALGAANLHVGPAFSAYGIGHWEQKHL